MSEKKQAPRILKKLVAGAALMLAGWLVVKRQSRHTGSLASQTISRQRETVARTLERAHVPDAVTHVIRGRR